MNTTFKIGDRVRVNATECVYVHEPKVGIYEVPVGEIRTITCIFADSSNGNIFYRVSERLFNAKLGHGKTSLVPGTCLEIAEEKTSVKDVLADQIAWLEKQEEREIWNSDDFGMLLAIVAGLRRLETTTREQMIIKITPCGSLNYRDSLKYFKAIATLQQAGWFVLPEFEFDGSRYITDQAKRKTQRKHKP